MLTSIIQPQTFSRILGFFIFSVLLAQCGLSSIRPVPLPDQSDTTQSQTNEEFQSGDTEEEASAQPDESTTTDISAETSAPRKSPPSGDSTGSTDGTPSTPESGTSDGSVSVASFKWDRVLISEVVTDPQQDHNDSIAVTTIPFDPFPGTGAITSSDEYIELYNGLDSTIDLSSWELSMRDGTDETQSLSDPTLTTFFSKGGAIDNVQAGEYIVLGNPKGLLNNEIVVELFDETGALEDSVSIEDANASSLSDEAYDRLEDGSWEMGFASPGY